MRNRKIGNYFKVFLENSSYYLSTMILFNVIYALKIVGSNINDSKPIKLSTFVTLLIAIILAIAGLLYTFLIFIKDHSIKNKNTKGKEVEIIDFSNITSENYFAKYSLLVLAGNSLPIFNNWVSLVVYLIVLLTLGIVYSKYKMYYMNPCLTLLGYNIVKAKCHLNYSETDYLETDYYFLFKKGAINKEQKIKFLNISNKIIRLKEVLNDPTN